jgi:hypothetical protein
MVEVKSAIAEPLTCELPAYLDYSVQDFQANNIAVITSETANPNYPSIPSLWWAEEKIDTRFKGGLITDWRAYPDQGHIDLIIDRQRWSLLNYLGRYRLINSFGNIAQEYGYSLRFMNQQANCLALYICNQGQCEVDFQGSPEDDQLNL